MSVSIFGIDLSMNSPGFAVIEIADGKPFLLHKSHLPANTRHTHGQKLMRIESHFCSLIEKYGPFDGVAREKGFSAHNLTTQVLFRAVGVSDLTLAKNGYTYIEEIAPTTIKKIMTGSGRGSKQEVADAVDRLIGKQNYGTDDESDAVAVALAYAIQRKLIEGAV